MRLYVCGSTPYHEMVVCLLWPSWPGGFERGRQRQWGRVEVVGDAGLRIGERGGGEDEGAGRGGKGEVDVRVCCGR